MSKADTCSAAWERMSHTHTSPSARLATIDRMRSRTGSPSALNTRATPAACAAFSGSRVSGGLHSKKLQRFHTPSISMLLYIDMHQKS
ncbi:hypothetical protein ACFSTC_27410 [Nonomuraea ferruginea]